jgi:D-beta-D-heptose 7-phosphate kinase/D-beta-D-heptose 1-phosphate adenosyltransferase
VILTTAQLAPFRGAVAMVDGGFDPLHAGHIAYFREAARLGVPVLCNVAPDAWVARKHRPLLAQAERAVVLDAIRHVDLVHPAAGPTEDVLRALAPRFYVKGADWRGRLPPEQEAICAERGTEIVFLDTVMGSSTALLRAFAP